MATVNQIVTVSHIAGPFVGIKSLDLLIQRCALCGEKLIDMRPSLVAVPVDQDGNADPLGVLPPGSVVRVTSGNPKSMTVLGEFVEMEKLPEDFCNELVERD